MDRVAFGSIYRIESRLALSRTRFVASDPDVSEVKER